VRLLLAALLAVGPGAAPAAPAPAAPALAAPAPAPPAVAAPATASAAPAQAGRYRLAVAFVPGLTWARRPSSDAAGVLRAAALGGVVPTTARAPGCAADFMLTLSAGARAGLPGSACALPAVVPRGRGATVEGWDAIVRANERRHDGARPGDLAATSGRCVAAHGPLAALAAAGPDGRVAEYHPALAATDCTVNFVDASGTTSLAATVAAIRDTLRPQGVLVVGVPDGAHYGVVAVLSGRGLVTGSPREPGLLTIPDLARFVLRFDGLTMRPGRPDAAVDRLTDLDRAGSLHRRYAGWYLGLGSLPLLLCLVLAFRPRLGRRLRPVALALAAYPVAGFLVSSVPWWRAGTPWLACAAGVLAAMVLVVLAGRGTEVGVAAVTVAAFAVDLLTGARLQRFGLASYSALNGGRFYGLGNVGFAIFATAAVVVAGAVARRYGVRAWLAAYPPLVLLDALPRWGADFGGAIALTAAFGAAVASRMRRTVVAAGAALGLVVAFAAAWLDYGRPVGDRTHLGAFVDDLLHGHAGDPLWRKADAAVHSVVGTAYPLVLIASLVVLTVLLRRLRDDALAPTARAVAALWLVGSLVNDSGIVVATAGAAVAVPLLLAYAIRRSPDGTPW
jgi:hypothetical protein